MQPPLLALVVILLAVACTTVDSLKPGVPRGVYESGFMKTTEGLSLRVANRSYDEIWGAADKAITARLTVIDRNKERGTLRGSDADIMGFTRSYVGIFISPVQPRAEFYTVEVSKIMHMRTHVAFTGPDFEAELLRAIQAEVGGQ
jgi:hypothetical protein